VERRKVLITGASGLIGSLTLQHLRDKYEFSSLSRRQVARVPHLSADIGKGVAEIQPAFTGIHTVLHLAAAEGPGENYDWVATMAGTVQGTLNVYEASRIAGVKRVVFFSSGMVQLAYEWDAKLPYGTLANGPDNEIPASWPILEVDAPLRPDSPFAVGKLFGENLGRYYADKYGISTLVVRSGAVLRGDRPTLRRHYPGYLSQSDCMQMIDKCLSAPESLLYDVFNALSENKYRWRSTEHTKQVLGWKPTGRSDIYPWK
jgi:NAD+ dependent glucose-6-phosphate dehydrogenase